MSLPLEVENLGVQWGSFKALDGITFKAQAGDFVAVLGPNGAGKSTLLEVILNLTEPTHGTVRVFGRPTAEAPPELTGYVPQVKTLDRNFPAVTCELVASGMLRRWPVRLSRSEHRTVMETLALVGAEHLCHRPIGWLSGGELQRVYLARALVRKPQLLLLDEPATGIDPVGEDDMYYILEQYQAKSDVTILMVTHDWLAARHHATQVLLLNRRQLSYGTPEVALADEPVRQAFGHVGHAHAEHRDA